MKIQLIKYIDGKKAPKRRWKEPGVFALRFIDEEGRETYEKLEETELTKAQEVLAERKADAKHDKDRQIAVLKAQLSVLESKRPALSVANLDEVWSLYLSKLGRRRPKESSLKASKAVWDMFVRAMKTERLSDVTQAKVSAYFSREESKNSVNTHNKKLWILRNIWQTALPGSPDVFEKVEVLPSIPKQKEERTNSWRTLTDDEMTRLLCNAEGERKTMLILAAYTGLRLGDISLLTWNEVDFENEVIRMDISKVTGRSGIQANLAMHPKVLAELKAVSKTKSESIYVTPMAARRYQTGRENASSYISAFFRKHNVLSDERGRAGINSLRHTIGNKLIREGMSPSQIATLYGHSSIITQRAYLHWEAQEQRKFLDQVSFSTDS